MQETEKRRICRTSGGITKLSRLSTRELTTAAFRARPTKCATSSSRRLLTAREMAAAHWYTKRITAFKWGTKTSHPAQRDINVSRGLQRHPFSSARRATPTPSVKKHPASFCPAQQQRAPQVFCSIPNAPPRRHRTNKRGH